MTFAIRPIRVAALAALASSTAASILYVDDNAPPGGDGAAWTTAHRYLQDALRAAQLDPGVTEIRIGAGVHHPDESGSGLIAPGDREAHFALLEGVAIRGGFRGLSAGGSPDDRDTGVFVTVLSGDLLGDDKPQWVNSAENTYHVVRATGVGPSARLDGVTVIGGNAWQSTGDHAAGAGLRFENASPSLLGNFNVTGAPGTLAGDLDGDGDVDFADLNALLGVYNSSC